MSGQQLEQKLQLAAETFRSYRKTAFAERSELMLRATAILDSDKQKYARLMTLEMGKPIKGAVLEIEKCALVCRYYAENAEGHLADEVVETNATRFCRFKPLGTVLAHALELSLLASVSFRRAALMAKMRLAEAASNVPKSPSD